MRFKRIMQFALIVWCLTMLLAGTSMAKTRKSQAKRTTTVSSKSHSSQSSKSAKNRARTSKGHHKTTARQAKGQQSPDSDRTREIQAALIREHYLSGDPSGSWDQQTREALTKYQKDNGWQTKMIPDSRALIKLGLGPSHDGLLNPDTAAIGNPHLAGNAAPQPGGSAN